MMSTSVFLDIIFFFLSGAHTQLDYEQSLFFLGPSSKTPETPTDHARDWRRETGEASFLASRGFAAQRLGELHSLN